MIPPEPELAPTVGLDDRPKNEDERRDLALMARLNRRSRRGVVDPQSHSVVTMTTYGERLRYVHLALESIARGSSRPRRLILWLDQPDVPLSAELRRLQRRGLEIITVEPGLRVHTKYYPYVSSLERHELSLVTSDDDILYPESWLADLEAAARTHPGMVLCYRSHRMALADAAIAPYATWSPTTGTEPSLLNFGTSVSGQLFPPVLLDRLREEGTAFLELTPMNDDVWIHSVAVSLGIPTMQITEHSQHFPFVPGTQATGLYVTNQWGGENDLQIGRSYTSDDVSALARAE